MNARGMNRAPRWRLRAPARRVGRHAAAPVASPASTSSEQPAPAAASSAVPELC